MRMRAQPRRLEDGVVFTHGHWESRRGGFETRPLYIQFNVSL
jgi:hypothetical protein